MDGLARGLALEEAAGVRRRRGLRRDARATRGARDALRILDRRSCAGLARREGARRRRGRSAIRRAPAARRGRSGRRCRRAPGRTAPSHSRSPRTRRPRAIRGSTRCASPVAASDPERRRAAEERRATLPVQADRRGHRCRVGGGVAPTPARASRTPASASAIVAGVRAPARRRRARFEGRLRERRSRVRYAEVDADPPRPAGLALPDGDELAMAGRRGRVLAARHRPGAGREPQVAGGRRLHEDRPPVEDDGRIRLRGDGRRAVHRPVAIERRVGREPCEERRAHALAHGLRGKGGLRGGERRGGVGGRERIRAWRRSRPGWPRGRRGGASWWRFWIAARAARGYGRWRAGDQTFRA